MTIRDEIRKAIQAKRDKNDYISTKDIIDIYLSLPIMKKCDECWINNGCEHDWIGEHHWETLICKLCGTQQKCPTCNGEGEVPKTLKDLIEELK